MAPIRHKRHVVNIALGVLFPTLLALLANIGTGDLPSGLKPYQHFAWPLLVLLMAITGMLLLWQGRLQEQTSTAKEQKMRLRRDMIRRVRNDWIENVLEKSVWKVARLRLNLKDEPEAVERASPLEFPVSIVLHSQERKLKSVGPGEIATVFTESGGQMLILGAPGAGKTTLLLELAQDLLKRAELDEVQRIPVVFKLSTWVSKRGRIDDWLADELNKHYDVPSILAREWVENEEIIPLLDGLDEVSPLENNLCVEFINQFRLRHGLQQIAICSRSQDYERLTRRLHLPGAVSVEPLTKTQVETYLETHTAFTEVRKALVRDPLIWTLLDTPLMLSIAILAYMEPGEDLGVGASSSKLRDRLFSKYVTVSLRRHRHKAIYSPAQVHRSLSWLARALGNQNKTIFYLDEIRPQWLPDAKAVTSQARLLMASIVPLTFASLFGIVSWIVFRTKWAALTVSLFGAIVALALVLFSDLDAIQPADKWRVSWPEIQSAASQGVGLLFVINLPFGLLGFLEHGSSFALMSIAMSGICYAFLIFSLGVYKGITPSALVIRARPNDGMLRSARSAVIAGVSWAVGWTVSFTLLHKIILVSGISSQRGTEPWLHAGFVAATLFGVIAAWNRGGAFCVNHFVLRFLLFRSGVMPGNYVRFLDFGVDHLLLQRAGAGYMFLHQMLREFFALSSHDTNPNLH